MSIYNGDLLDDGLQSVMGKDRCQKVWQGTPAKEEKVVWEKTPRAREKTPAATESWVPVREKTQMDKLKACGKDALLYGGLSLLFFYFQQSGQMLPSAAMPCICACCVLLGLGVGKNAR